MSGLRAMHELSELGRARRLRPLAMAALEAYDIDVVRLRLITNGWNCVFRVDTLDDRRFVLRVTLPRPERPTSVVWSEIQFMAAVADGADITVPHPIANRDGDLTTTRTAPGVPEARECVLFSWVSGPDLAHAITPKRYYRLGVLSASLHRFAREWDPPPGFETVTFDSTIHMGESMVLFGDAARERLSARQRGVVASTVEKLDDQIAEVHGRGPVVMTHGDLHQWNVKVDRGTFAVIDFEDFQWAVPILDVATTLYYVRRRPDYLELARAFRAGYSSVEPWVETRPGEIDTLIPARGIDLLNYCFFQKELEADIDVLAGRILGDAEAAMEGDPLVI